MKLQHTSEPWSIVEHSWSDTSIYGGYLNRQKVCSISIADEASEDDQEIWEALASANSRRIVACVNACEGINPEAVPELLEALIELVDCVDGNYKEVADMARAAIAKAKGGQP